MGNMNEKSVLLYIRTGMNEFYTACFFARTLIDGCLKSVVIYTACFILERVYFYSVTCSNKGIGPLLPVLLTSHLYCTEPCLHAPLSVANALPCLFEPCRLSPYSQVFEFCRPMDETLLEFTGMSKSSQ